MTRDLRTPVVVNADDLGMSSGGNRAILESLERGLITSATIMVNMPGFDEACAMIRAHGFTDRIGVHLNLTQGSPLSDPIRLCPRFCGPAGQLSGTQGPAWHLATEEARAVEVELAAQVEALIARGITPSHFDSHHHVHTRWPVSTIVMRLAHGYGVPAIRLTRNCGPGLGLLKRTYKTAFNARLARAGLAPTRHFGSVRDVASLGRLAGAVEIMVHLELDGEGDVVDVTSGARPLEDVVARWRSIGTLMSYRELCAL